MLPIITVKGLPWGMAALFLARYRLTFTAGFAQVARYE